MKLYLILGLMRLARPLAKNMLMSRGKKKTNKTKQINKIIEKEREIQKRIYSISLELGDIAIYNIKPMAIT